MEIGGEPHHPARLIELGEADLRTVGLSSAKARYVLNLAEAVASGQVPLDQFDDSWDDQAITQSLTAIKGIGVWTAEMFLIFALNRPDILPDERPGRAGSGCATATGWPSFPSRATAMPWPRLWRPYRTIASWYIWKGTRRARSPARRRRQPRSVARRVESGQVNRHDI